MNQKTKEFRAIYLYDLGYENMPVFEYNFETKAFDMIGNPELSYLLEWVIRDKDFIIFEVVKDKWDDYFEEWLLKIKRIKPWNRRKGFFR